MDWRELWTSSMGTDPPFRHFSPYAAALLVYATLLLSTYALYLLASLLPKVIRPYLQTFVKTMAFCSFSFGHKIIWKYYGGWGYMLTMIPILTLGVHIFSEGYGSPLGNWACYLRGESSTTKFLLMTIIQVLGGIAAFKLGKYVYLLDFDPLLSEDLQQTFCKSDLKVPAYVGVFLEFLGSGYDAWFWMQSISKNSILDSIVKFFNMGIVVIFGK